MAVPGGGQRRGLESTHLLTLLPSRHLVMKSLGDITQPFDSKRSKACYLYKSSWFPALCVCALVPTYLLWAEEQKEGRGWREKGLQALVVGGGWEFTLGAR